VLQSLFPGDARKTVTTWQGLERERRRAFFIGVARSNLGLREKAQATISVYDRFQYQHVRLTRLDRIVVDALAFFARTAAVGEVMGSRAN